MFFFSVQWNLEKVLSFPLLSLYRERVFSRNSPPRYSLRPFKGRLNTDTSPQNFLTTFLDNDWTENVRKSAVSSAIAIPLPLCFSCFVPLRWLLGNLTKLFYFYLSRTCDSPGGTPSVISFALNQAVSERAGPVSPPTCLLKRRRLERQRAGRERIVLISRRTISRFQCIWRQANPSEQINLILVYWLIERFKHLNIQSFKW